ncbi:MAG: AI-2E family transporter [Mycetocola sp.]
MKLRFWHHDKKPHDATDASPDAESALPTLETTPVARTAFILMAWGGAAAAVFGLWAIRGVVAPIALALVLTICAHPIRAVLERIRVPRGVATVIAMLLVFALLACFVGAFLVALAQFTTLIPQFTPELQQLGEDISAWLAGIGIDSQSAETIVQGLEPSNIIDFAAGLLGGVSGIVFGLVVILTLVMLMAMDGAYLPALLAQLRPQRPSLVGALTGFATGVRRYMIAATCLGVLQSTLNWVGLVLLQVPAAFLWALLSFICSFIPNIGYFIAIIPPTVFGLLVGGWPTAVAVIVVYGVINVVVQSIVQPLLVANVVALNQTLTFVSVLFWAVVLGPVGAVLAVPLTLLVRTILIDADPRARWWRPLTGDIDEVKAALKATDAEAKATRVAKKQHRHGRRPAA